MRGKALKSGVLAVLLSCLVLLGMSSQSVAGLLCRTEACPKRSAEAQTEKSCCPQKADQPQKGDDCCCSVKSSPDAAQFNTKVTPAGPLQIVAITVSVLEVVYNDQVINRDECLAHSSDSSPPERPSDPHLGRAPPVN